MYLLTFLQPPAPLEPESATDGSGGSQPLSALATEPSPSSTAQPTQSAPLPVASQYVCEKTPGTGPNQQRLNETQKTILDIPRANNRGSWRQPERRHLKGGEYNAHKGTNDTQELPPPKGPKEPVNVKPEEPHNQGVGGPSQENGPGNWQGPPPRRTRDYARWERSKNRTPSSSYPRLPRGRGTSPPGTRREPLSLESEDGS